MRVTRGGIHEGECTVSLAATMFRTLRLASGLETPCLAPSLLRVSGTVKRIQRRQTCHLATTQFVASDTPLSREIHFNTSTGCDVRSLKG